MARICLVVPYHVSFQPRTLREADSLDAMGHDVRVVSRVTDGDLAERDRRVMARRRWRLETVDLRSHGRSRHAWLRDAIVAKVADRLFAAGWRRESLAIRAYVRGFPQLLHLAAAEPADWFIAHTHVALPVAAAAATRWGARLGFDCEDLLAERGTDPRETISLIERRYIPGCHYVSTPSACVAARLAETCAPVSPIVLYNVFPLGHGRGTTPPAARATGPALRVHWFGQTLGAGRGLEEAIEAVALAGGGIELHFRGRVSDRYRTVLTVLAERHGVREALSILPPVDHDDLVGAVAQHDVGLALEPTDNVNTALTASNKLFAYLLAGLAVSATDTPGQREVMAHAPGAGILYRPGHPRELAAALARWRDDRRLLTAAQDAAWEAARRRFCWEQAMPSWLAALGLAAAPVTGETIEVGRS